MRRPILTTFLGAAKAAKIVKMPGFAPSVLIVLPNGFEWRLDIKQARALHSWLGRYLHWVRGNEQNEASRKQVQQP